MINTLNNAIVNYLRLGTELLAIPEALRSSSIAVTGRPRTFNWGSKKKL